MDFSNFGRVSFTKQAKISQFVDYLTEGNFMMTRCKSCGRNFFPPRQDCFSCASSNMEWIEVKGPGKLLSFTTVYYGPSGFENDIPYTLGIAEFENGIKILGRVSKKVNVKDIKVGMKLKIVPIKLDNEHFSYELET